jgi:hypothetical protein
MKYLSSCQDIACERLGLNDCSLKFCKRRDVFPLSPSPTLGPTLPVIQSTLQALLLRVKQTTHQHQAQRWSGALSPMPLLVAVFGQNVFLLHYINFPPQKKFSVDGQLHTLTCFKHETFRVGSQGNRSRACCICIRKCTWLCRCRRERKNKGTLFKQWR